jgi:hypothetical protein
MSFSSFKESQLLFENWRKFLNEQGEEEVVETSPEEKFFVILLGGSGTGKGALVGTNRAIGELQKLIGQSIGRPVKVGSADAIKSGEAGARVVFEPDRILRVFQWTQAKSDFERMKRGESPEEVLADLDKTGEGSLKKAILNQLGDGGIKRYNTVEDYVGRLTQVGGGASKAQALAMSDALDKDFGGDPKIQFAYKQMRKRPFKGGSTGIKSASVVKAKEEMRGAVGRAKGVADSFILDSAGEDLASQDVAGELKTAKEAGFSTAIVLLATGAVQSFLGNMERAVARGGRNVDSAEIMSFYKVLLEKHYEFGRLVQSGDLDEYIVLEQDPIDSDEIEELVKAICNPGELLGLDIPDIAGNEIEACIPALANPSYLPAEEESAAKQGAATVDKGASPDASIKNWDQAFTYAAKAGVVDDPKKAKKTAMFKGLYPKMQAARTTGEPEILRPINAKTDFKIATAAIAKALKMASIGAKMKVTESKMYKRWKVLIG